MGTFRCKACDYQSKYKVRLRSHIANRHFNGPPCTCKICGTSCKNINSLKQHITRNHKYPKEKKRIRNRSYNVIQKKNSENPPTGTIQIRPECPPPPPPTPAVGHAGLGQLGLGSQNGSRSSLIPSSEKRTTATLSLREAVTTKLDLYKTGNSRKQPLNQVHSHIAKTPGFSCGFCGKAYKNKQDLTIH